MNDFEAGRRLTAGSPLPGFSGTGFERLEESQRQMEQISEGLRRQNNPVLDIFDDLNRMVARFQAELDAEHEVGICVSGSISLIHIRSINRRPPSLLIFEGMDGEGRKTVAIQHVAQLNLQLVAVPKIEDEPYRIGFVQPAK